MTRLRCLALALVAGTVLAGCQSEAPEIVLSPGVNTPDALAGSRAACEAAGGSFGRPRGGGDAQICFRTPEDANAACSRSTDCAGVCLARSRTCAPVIPLLGCNAVLTATGAEATVCID